MQGRYTKIGATASTVAANVRHVNTLPNNSVHSRVNNPKPVRITLKNKLAIAKNTVPIPSGPEERVCNNNDTNPINRKNSKCP